jgi:hypothetical protein
VKLWDSSALVPLLAEGRNEVPPSSQLRRGCPWSLRGRNRSKDVKDDKDIRDKKDRAENGSSRP